MELEKRDYAAELEQYLKERRGAFTQRDLIRDIRVSPEGEKLKVELLSWEGILSFGAMRFKLKKDLQEKAWTSRKKGIFDQLKNCRPQADPALLKRMEEEAGRKLEEWRRDHPFNKQMKDFLSSKDAAAYFSGDSLLKLRFLEGKKALTPAQCVIGKDHLTLSFQAVPLQAVYHLSSGKISIDLTGVNFLYKKLAALPKDDQSKKQIESYFRERGWKAYVRYKGKPGCFIIRFYFEEEAEEEDITVSGSFRRIVSCARRRAEKRAGERKREREKKLKDNPFFGSCMARAVLETVEDFDDHVTEARIVRILRGTGLTREDAYSRHSGKYRMLESGDISSVIEGLEKCGLISSRDVHGEYRNYTVYRLTRDGKILDQMIRGSTLKKNPVTQQEYLLYMRSVRDHAGSLPDRRKKALLKMLVLSPALFLTDPEPVLDCMEGMGQWAADILKRYYEKEEDKGRKRILKLLWNAAAGKGKVLPKKAGLTEFLARERAKERKKEEAERRDRELLETVLTEIPGRYVDLYPAARAMKRHFILHIGPTNSGKTHEALKDLMKAEKGIYLGPLRLLAAEIFEKMNGEGCPCSLVTGEEECQVEGAAHQSSTIEMADLRKWYHTAVIDEAQMISDPDRGGAWAAAMMGLCALRIHVCTAPEGEKCLTEIISECGDDFEIIRHSRMTPLVFEDQIFHFPEDVREGDALIVFFRMKVHAVAAQLKKRKVECSIIYGALPYDVRLGQAERFCRNEAKVVVATDAIGMGMNLPIRRVVLLETEKFDGVCRRNLTEQEIRQITGRAGRYGIYDTGYAAAAEDTELVKKALESPAADAPLPVIGFPETILSVDASLLELIRKWKEVSPLKGWRKASTERMYALAEMTEKLKAKRELAYAFLTVPFDEKNGELLQIWLSVFEKEVRGKNYSICGMAEAMPDAVPSGGDTLSELEQEYRVLDLYYHLARKFQPLERTLSLIMDKRRKCSEAIMRILDERAYQKRRCRSCGRELPWDYRYGLCQSCYQNRYWDYRDRWDD